MLAEIYKHMLEELYESGSGARIRTWTTGSKGPCTALILPRNALVIISYCINSVKHKFISP